ncbi:hypothetical protein [Nocardia sp. NPDC057227]|uniref:hypothetical protein n=1 Tax=Nocardia sp. NPDC057227 TaxID=3346056 RepID=UPI00362AD1C8
MSTTDRAAHHTATLRASSSAGILRRVAVLDELFAGALGGIFERMEWAEEEIVAARARNPRRADRIHHSFCLLNSHHDRMATEFVYRSHCRELLDRVATDQDTRPATAAEICCAMLQISLFSPLRSSAASLYFRMWQAAGFPEIPEITAASSNHEALEKDRIDDHEHFARRKLAVLDRQLGEIVCAGQHHGESVDCTYSSQPRQPGMSAANSA